MVQVDYSDNEFPNSDAVIWEREIQPAVLEARALPDIALTSPMSADEFSAIQRAVRWSSMSPFRPATGMDDWVMAPYFGAVQTDDYQLVPVLSAMRMPRISLLVADDVGMGKTIEAGFVISELFRRRRINRVLILCGASLRHQWKDEMHSKFSTTFEIIDKAATHDLQKNLGLDANPWRTFPRVISSYHFIKQPDILEQFLSTCRQSSGTTSANLPWDLLIVDEAHNLAPSNFGRNSDLAEMLTRISPYFEHKLFLTATPHNGYTRSFSGLLEQLNPVLFTRTSEFTERGRGDVEQTVIRRLKKEINQADKAAGRVPRFAERFIEPLPLYLSKEETALTAAYAEFQANTKKILGSRHRGEQLAGHFALSVLNKRLLSCPFTFADSWFRIKEGLAQEEIYDAPDVEAANRAVDEDIDDDLEIEGRTRYAAKTIGGWLKHFEAALRVEIEAVDRALQNLGLTYLPDGNISFPAEDARWVRLHQLVKSRLREAEDWVTDERLVIFSEYKTTLDYIERRMRDAFPGETAIRVLFGGMNDSQREEIKRAFNDPENDVRILIATDVASEGQNLQETARLLLHFETPWNPSKMEQRNGRLDRHGQARDVTVYHFTSEDDADLMFLAHVMEKVNSIREDLGSMGEIFDAAFERRFTDLQDADDVIGSLELAVEQRKKQVDIPRQTLDISDDSLKAYKQLATEIDLTPDSLQSTLEMALGLRIGLPRLDATDTPGKAKLRHPIPPDWKNLIDDEVRLKGEGGQPGALPALAFDPRVFLTSKHGREVFRPSKDSILLHLGHPLVHHAIGALAKLRFPGSSAVQPSLWTVSHGDVPSGADALILLTVEELAVNELREPFHHWVTTHRLPVRQGALGEELPHVPAGEDSASTKKPNSTAVERAKEIWEDVDRPLKKFIETLKVNLTSQLTDALAGEKNEALDAEREKFAYRQKEVSKALQNNTLQKLENEIEELSASMSQMELFTENLRDKEVMLRQLEDELNRRKNHYQELLGFLKTEQTRILDSVLPLRFTLRGDAQIFPVTVEIRLPE